MTSQPFQAQLRRAGLRLIRTGRSLFYNTWVQRLPVTDWAYRRLFYFLYRDEPETIVAFRGLRFHVDTSDITIVPSLLNGTYESAEISEFERLLSPGMSVLDLGANIGVYSLVAAKKVGPEGRVYAFEPERRNLELLRRNMNENHVENIEVFASAVGDNVGTLTLFLAEGSLGTHSVGSVGTRHTEVKVTRVDDALAALDRPIDVIKMDIEGYEPAALRGMASLLRRCEPTLMVEFNPTSLTNCGFSPAQFYDELSQQFRHFHAVRDGALRLLSQAERAQIRSSNKAINLFVTNRDIAGRGDVPGNRAT